MELGDWATWAGTVAAVITSIVALSLAVSLRNREKREGLAALHRDLTTGETADARHVIGKVLHARRDLGGVGDETAVRSFFVLYWAVERSFNHHLAIGSRVGKLQGEFLDYNLNELANNIIVFRNRHRVSLGIQDAEAWASFEKRIKIMSPGLWEKYFTGEREYYLDEPI